MKSTSHLNQVPVLPFLAALIGGPVIVSLAVMGLSLPLSPMGGYAIALVSVVFGGPVYLIIGAPLLWHHLRHHPPSYAGHARLVVLTLIGLLSILAMLALLTEPATLLNAVPFVMICAAVFGQLWTAAFTFIYLKATADQPPHTSAPA